MKERPPTIEEPRVFRVVVSTGGLPVRIIVPPGAVILSVPLDAPRETFTRAGQAGYRAAQRALRDRTNAEALERTMHGRADVFELYARVGSWPKVRDAIISSTDSTDPLVQRVRAWARGRMLGSQQVGQDARRAARAEGNVGHLDAKVVKRWAMEQTRYATDADFDDSDWNGPVEERWPARGDT